MRVLDPLLIAELGLTVTSPGYLIELGFSSTLRLSTIGDVNYNLLNWISSDIRVSGISQNGSGSSNGLLTLTNTDGVFGALILSEGVTNKSVKVYACYAGAIDAAILVFEGVTDGGEVGTSKVTINLSPQANRTLFSPRVFISKPIFNFLQPEGTKIVFNGETFILERE